MTDLIDAVADSPQQIVHVGLKRLQVTRVQDEAGRTSLTAGGTDSSGAWLGMPALLSPTARITTLMASLCHDLLLLPQYLDLASCQA